MPRGSKPGERRGGRKKNTPNRTLGVLVADIDLLAEKGLVIAAQILENNKPCSICRGALKTRYVLPEDQRGKKCPCVLNGEPAKDCWKCSGTGQQRLSERTCESCYGTAYERLSPELCGKTALEVMKYKWAQKKAIELSNPDGSLRPRWEVHVPVPAMVSVEGEAGK